MTTAQKLKFSIKDFFSKCDQIRTFQRIWSHLLKKFLKENFAFCVVFGFIAFVKSPKQTAVKLEMSIYSDI